MESTLTAFFYLLNLIFMILSSILIVGILLISLLIYLEGTLPLPLSLLCHLLIPLLVLTLNIYVIMLEEPREDKWLKRGGMALITGAVVVSGLALAGALFWKRWGSEQAGEEGELGVLFVEECLLYGMAVGEAATLREYGRLKMRDFQSIK